MSVVPGEMLNPDAPHQAMRSLDTLVSSCRVLGTWGLQGSAFFSILDGDSPVYDPGDRKYPDAETARVVLRLSSIPITPGHVVGLDVVALPSGPNQYQPLSNEWAESGRGGTVTMTVTYTNSDAETITAVAGVTPSASDRVYGAEPANGHASLETYSATATPFGLVPSAVDREKFARGGDVLVDVVVEYAGSPRVVSFAVVERPAAMVVDMGSAEWPSAMYAAGGAAYEQLPSDYPVEQLTSSDPGGGVEGLRRALEQHGLQLGPCLAWQSSGREGVDMLTWLDYDDGTGEDEAPPFTSSSSSFIFLPYGAALASAQFPGFQLGGYARQARDSDEWFDGRTGVLPVWATVYAYAKEGVFQWRTGLSEWSAINIDATGEAWGWFIKPGWIEVGTAPDDAPVARLLGKDTGAASWRWRYGGLFHRQR